MKKPYRIINKVDKTEIHFSPKDKDKVYQIIRDVDRNKYGVKEYNNQLMITFIIQRLSDNG